MSPSAAFGLLLLHSVLWSIASAYTIDASCNGQSTSDPFYSCTRSCFLEANLDFVKNMVAAGFGLVQSAYDAVAVQDINNVDDEVKDLMKWLFTPSENYELAQAELASE